MDARQRIETEDTVVRCPLGANKHDRAHLIPSAFAQLPICFDLSLRDNRRQGIFVQRGYREPLEEPDRTDSQRMVEPGSKWFR